MDFRSSLYRPKTKAPPVVLSAGMAFGEVPPTPAAGGPVAVYLTGRDDSWCATRRGVWWSTQGVWVDRMELTGDELAPSGARTYPLIPGSGLVIGAVHGQVLDDVAHVLVTAPGNRVITQVSARFAGPRELALLVLVTLAAAHGDAVTPSAAVSACTSEVVLRELGTANWTSPGWSVDAADLPGRVVKVLGL